MTEGKGVLSDRSIITRSYLYVCIYLCIYVCIKFAKEKPRSQYRTNKKIGLRKLNGP